MIVMNDLRFAIRQLLKNPGFAAVAVLTLALGICAVTTLFSTLNGVWLRGLPFPDPDHLIGITGGRGFDWETTCFDVTPLCYAQMGLLPQVQRRGCDIYSNIRRMLQSSGRNVPTLSNFPNRYLYPKGKA